MSYSGLGTITVGQKAQSDLVMAEASLRAAKIVEAASKSRTRAEKHRIVQRRLDAIGAGVAARASREYKRLIAAGKAEDQATFDAMRLAIANWMIDETLRIAAEYQPGASGLGKFSFKKAFGIGRDIVCVGGGVASVAVPAATAAIASAQDAAGCNKRAQKTARQTARAQTAQAQAALAAAQANAETERLRAQREAASGKTMTKLALIGGGVVVVGLGVWLMLRKR
jgi:hypothetical protein